MDAKNSTVGLVESIKELFDIVRSMTVAEALIDAKEYGFGVDARDVAKLTVLVHGLEDAGNDFIIDRA